MQERKLWVPYRNAAGESVIDVALFGLRSTQPLWVYHKVRWMAECTPQAMREALEAKAEGSPSMLDEGYWKGRYT